MTTATEPQTHRGGRSSWALVTDRTFGIYFVGNLVSNLGTWLQNIAAAIVVDRLTGSALAVGAVSMLQFSASLLLGSWAGAVSDRVDRRLLLIVGQVVSVVPAAVLAVWTFRVGVDGLPGAWPVLAAAAIIGIGWAISVPTMQALVPALVEPDDLEQAVALNSITFNLARAIGPAAGATAIATFGAATAFGVNAASYVVLIVALLLVRPRPVANHRERGDGSVREGLRYVRANPALAVLLIGVAALGFGTDPVITLAPAMARTLGGGEHAVGWLASSFGIGAAVMAFGVGMVRKRVSLARLGVVGLALLSTGLVGWAVSRNVATGVGALFVAGTGFLLALTGLTTELQRRVPQQFLGRVMALWAVAFLGSRPAAALLDGALGDTFGPRVAVASAAVITGGTALWLHRSRHHLRLDDDAVPLASAATGAADAGTPQVSG